MPKTLTPPKPWPKTPNLPPLAPCPPCAGCSKRLGYVTKEDFISALMRLVPPGSADNAQLAKELGAEFDSLDTNGDGQLSFEEFSAVLVLCNLHNSGGAPPAVAVGGAAAGAGAVSAAGVISRRTSSSHHSRNASGIGLTLLAAAAASSSSSALPPGPGSGSGHPSTGWPAITLSPSLAQRVLHASALDEASASSERGGGGQQQQQQQALGGRRLSRPASFRILSAAAASGGGGRGRGGPSGRGAGGGGWRQHGSHVGEPQNPGCTTPTSYTPTPPVIGGPQPLW